MLTVGVFLPYTLPSCFYSRGSTNTHTETHTRKYIHTYFTTVCELGKEDQEKTEIVVLIIQVQH